MHTGIYIWDAKYPKEAIKERWTNFPLCQKIQISDTRCPRMIDLKVNVPYSAIIQMTSNPKDKLTPFPVLS